MRGGYPSFGQNIMSTWRGEVVGYKRYFKRGSVLGFRLSEEGSLGIFERTLLLLMLKANDRKFFELTFVYS